MKAKTILWALACCAVLLIGSCGNPWMEKIVDPLFETPVVTEPETPGIAEPVIPPPVITAFYFTINGVDYGVGPGVLAGSGSINAGTITVFLPTDIYDANINSQMTPVIEVSPSDAILDPTTALNFSTPRIYTVTSAGGSSVYTVKVARTRFLDADGTDDVTELRTLIGNAQNGDTLILSGTFTVPSDSNNSAIKITNKDITILAPAGGMLRFERSGTVIQDRIFRVQNWGKLTLGGNGGAIVFDGGAIWDGGTPAQGATNTTGRTGSQAFIEVSGAASTFTMNDGVTLQNNDTGLHQTSSALDVRGTAIINGGVIKNCKSDNSGDSSTIYVGANNGNSSSLTIYNVEITGNRAPDNTGGSILVSNDDYNGWGHTLTLMSGGDIKIHDNIPYTNGPYGSIYVKQPGSQTIQLNEHEHRAR
jgi:hypothetical protein